MNTAAAVSVKYKTNKQKTQTNKKPGPIQAAGPYRDQDLTGCQAAQECPRKNNIAAKLGRD
jgi:hypothetical protein